MIGTVRAYVYLTTTVVANNNKGLNPTKENNVTTANEVKDAEQKIMSLIEARPTGVARDEMMEVLKVSRPTIDKILKGLKLQVISRDRRKEFFGKEGITAVTSSVASTTAPDMAQTRAYKRVNVAPSRDDTRRVLAEAALANARIIESLTKSLS